MQMFNARAASALLLLAAACEGTETAGLEVSGVISESTTWRRASCPVELTGDLYVQGPSGPVLTIEPGCEVRVRAGFGIYVAYDGQPGALSAVGTAEQPISFVSAGRAEPGAWSGIKLDPATRVAETRFVHVAVRHAGGAHLLGGLHASDASPVIQSSSFRDNEDAGLHFEGSAGFGPGSSAVTATGNRTFGVVIEAATADSIPEDGSYQGNSAGGVQVRGGTIQRSATWGAVGLPYVVSEDLYVQGETAPVWTLTEGVALAFAPGKGVYVAYDGRAGALAVRGTAEAPVVMAAHGSSDPGAWTGVVMSENTTDSATVLEHLTLRHGGGAFSEGCLDLRGARPTLKNVRLERCEGFGLHLDHDASLAEGSTGLVSTDHRGAAVSLMAPAVASLPRADSSYEGSELPGIRVRGGTVARSGTWQDLGVPYVVEDDLYVQGEASPVLTAAAGVRLEMAAGKGIYVAYDGRAGGLAASGTAQAPVVFSSHQNPSKGAWSGILFHDATLDSASVLDGVVVEWAGGDFSDANVQTNDARPTIRNARIWRGADCGVRIYCSQGGERPTLENVEFGVGDDANESGDVCDDAC